jgi:predicted ATP-dependent endonuclease of OLD family
MSSEINAIKKKMATTNWPKFVMNLSVKGIHGLDGKQINFKFPLCALVGENGTCKSTILKTLACAYKNKKDKTFFPSDFFPDTAWDRLKNVVLKYQIRIGDEIKTHSITKPTERWRGLERPENRVYWLDLNRMQPIESLIGASKLSNKKIKEISTKDLTPESISKLSEVMGRDYLGCRYVTTSANDTKEVGLLKLNFGEMSKFHQGTGESIVSDIISLIENIPDYSLVIIDEIESSLHPKSQRRLIKQLLKLIRVKMLQIVFSTHSPYILSEVPPESRVLLTRINDGIEIVYAPSVEFCLSQIDDKMHSELDVLVEDEISKILLSEIIRFVCPRLLERISILPVGSADIIEVLMKLQNSGKCPYNLLGFVDADQTNLKDSLKLPGNFSPEKQIILDLYKSDVKKRLSNFFLISEPELIKLLEDVKVISNSHEWLAKMSDKLNVDCNTLWSYLSRIWAIECFGKEEAQKLVEIIHNRLEI